MRIAVVVGTRPEIVKMATVIHELRSRGADLSILHTGQHYDSELSARFFKDLELPDPRVNLETGSGTQAEQTATALQRLEQQFLRDPPNLVLVQGDTNTTLAGALAAVKLGIRVGHVESGLRSYDRRMPEELNRRVTDHIADLLFAPTAHAADILRRESCRGVIHMTGNTAIDACLRYAPKAPFKLSTREPFALATAHRAENVDDPMVLGELIAVFTACPLPVVYPIHPRTRERLRAAGLERVVEESANVQLLPPTGYLEFLSLMMRCSFVLTDSGGIQEEATAPNIRKKVFVLRDSTERPEAVEAGYAEVVGTRSGPVLERIRSFLSEDWSPTHPSPFGDGTAGRRIVDILLRV